jgi:diguanylate cyclase (GGDEF)-like protein/PAS domain S-box-containing protein
MVLDLRAQSSANEMMPPLWRILRVALLLGLLSFATRELNMSSWGAGGVTILWPTNGFLLGILLTAPRRHWAAYLAIGFSIDLPFNLGLHDAVFSAFYLSTCNAGEVLLAAFLLAPYTGTKPDLTKRRQFVAFLLYGVFAAPAVASLAASFHISGYFAWPTVHDFHRWFTADALGIATVTPLCFALSGRRPFAGHSKAEVLGLFGFLLVVTAGVFLQTRYPLLFVVLPVLLLLGMRLGLAGSAMGLLLVSIVGGFLSTGGRGPIALIAGTLSERDLIFQSFIATAMLLLYIVEVLITEARGLQADLLGSERRFRLLAEASSDVIVLTDLQGRRHYVSPAAAETVGWSPEEILGGSFRELAHPEDVPMLERLFEDCRQGEAARAIEYRFLKANGDYVWLEINPRLYRDPDTGRPAGFVNVVRDISLRKAEEEEQRRSYETIEHMAISDALTGIANRRHFDAVLEREWLRAAREKSNISLLLIDVDRFKPYNDVYGHLVGDECLRQVVAAVRPLICRPADLLARYGGEEFVVVLPNTDAHGAIQMAERIRVAVEERRLPHPGNPPHGVITLSVGCATTIPEEGLDHIDLLEAADRALYRAKSSGRNRVQMAQDSTEEGPVLLIG